MSWIKKIIGKKDGAKPPGRSVPDGDETVLFGDDSADAGSTPSYDPAPSARSSMISELAGLDPEASAYLSPSQESTPEDNHSEESISLDFDDPSDQQATAVFTKEPEPSDQQATAVFTKEPEPSDQQATAVFTKEPEPSDQQATAVFTADEEPSKDADSAQQKTAIYSDELPADQPEKPANASPATATPARSIPELEFDSDARLDTNFDDPPAESAPDLEPLAFASEPDPSVDSAADPDLSSETLPPSGQMSMIEQMAGGFDLDLGEEDEPTAEAFGISAPELEPAISDEAQSVAQPTADQPAQPSAQDDDDYSDQLATAKMDAPASPVVPTEAPHSADDFDATVITTAASEPSHAAGADYVTGWLVVVDGPGKGQSRPIRAGINAIGRAPDQAIPLYFGAKSDGEISRRDHARIVYDPRGNHFKLVHGASRNLTYLNDEAVLDITELKPYDRIVIGKTTLLFIPLCGNIFRW